MPGDYLSDAAPLIYLMGKEDSVPATVRRKLSDPKSEVFYSHISIWDIQMKHQLGRLSMSDEPAVVLHRELAATASACAPGSFRPVPSWYLQTRPSRNIRSRFFGEEKRSYECGKSFQMREVESGRWKAGGGITFPPFTFHLPPWPWFR